jgi:hypothetical protein
MFLLGNEIFCVIIYSLFSSLLNKTTRVLVILTIGSFCLPDTSKELKLSKLLDSLSGFFTRYIYSELFF